MRRRECDALGSRRREEALVTADREGLTFHRKESSTGFKGV